MSDVVPIDRLPKDARKILKALVTHKQPASLNAIKRLTQLKLTDLSFKTHLGYLEHYGYAIQTGLDSWQVSVLQLLAEIPDEI